MAKGVSKRYYHKHEMEKVDRTALIIGGVAAAAILVAMVASFLT